MIESGCVLGAAELGLLATVGTAMVWASVESNIILCVCVCVYVCAL